MFKKQKGPHSPEVNIPASARREITTAQKLGGDAIFHGACIGCIYKAGNAVGAERINWCLGCTFSTFSDNLPNRRISKYDGALPEDM